MEDKPIYSSVMFTFADGSERTGYFTETGGVMVHVYEVAAEMPAPSEPVSWVHLSDWIEARAAKPKPVEPPEANEYIMVTFEDGTKKVGFYSAASKSYRIYQENWIGRGAEDSDKRVIAWEYLSKWINDRL